MRRRRSLLTADEIQRASAAIQSTVIQSKEFNRARTVGAYYPVNCEVRTDTLIDTALKFGKKVALPKANDENLVFFHIARQDELVLGRFKIPEPPETASPSDEPDIVLVPGLAFDRKGYRLGYGKGYYDKFLRLYSGFSMGLAYNFQVMENVPHNDFDVKINALAVDNKLERFRSGY